MLKVLFSSDFPWSIYVSKLKINLYFLLYARYLYHSDYCHFKESIDIKTIIIIFVISIFTMIAAFSYHLNIIKLFFNQTTLFNLYNLLYLFIKAYFYKGISKEKFCLKPARLDIFDFLIRMQNISTLNSGVIFKSVKKSQKISWDR